MKAGLTIASASLLLVIGVHTAAADFEKEIRPLLIEYCTKCHSTEKQKGDLDLERFTSLAEVKKDPKVWESALEQLSNKEMPPKDKPQLSPGQKVQLMGWLQATLDEIALASAGDPGPVVLRRLSNMEYTYTLRDLTGVESLDPAREFPVDGAAGEGFTNVGAALVMSPTLLSKYLEAAKEVARHTVLLPDGVRFSPSTSPQDWKEEALARIRALYARHTTGGEASQTVAQGIKLDTGTGTGRLPLARYLDALQGRGGAEGLSPKYLGLLRAALTGTQPSLLLDPLRAKFQAKELSAADIEPWQKALWRFANVGHIGKLNGPKAWQEPVSPLVPQTEMRVKLASPSEQSTSTLPARLDSDKDHTLYLVTRDAGDGDIGDEVVWENARLVAKGRDDVPIARLPELVKHLEAQRAKIIASTEPCLTAFANGGTDADPEMLAVWRESLGFGTTALEPLIAKKMDGTPDYNFIKGWTGENALSVVANSSDATVRIPGVMKAHSIATHPSPTRASVIAWRSPAAATLRISGDVADAHPECGNGITWALEVRRGNSSEVLASGVSKGATVLLVGPFENVRIEAGQVIALVIGPRDGNHTCDLTAVNLTLGDGTTTWDLAKDISPNILAGNPQGPWHFLSQPATQEAASDLPAPLAEWRKAPSPALAAKVREHLEKDFPLHSPLLASAVRSFRPAPGAAALTAKAPSVIELNIPAALAKGAEFVVTGRLASKTEGSVQMQVLMEKPGVAQGLVAGPSETSQKNGLWSENNLVTQYRAPVIVNDGSEARRRFETAFEEFRALFPIALCYTRIVPVDEVVTLTLFYREDTQLKRLILDDAESRELDRWWEEMLFVSEAPLKQVDAFEQLWQYATQDANPKAFEPMREPILKAAAEFKEKQKTAEAAQRQAVVAFAAKAWRRPLTEPEVAALRQFPPRLMLTRVLASPAFLYRGESALEKTAPVNDWELSTRLSYFLWSSAPDDELRSLAAAGRLRDPEVLAAQARRMVKEARVRRLATEFGCQWLHVRDVATLDEKSERHFPTFASLRGDMQEEVVRFFMDLFQENRSVLSLLNADYSFVSGPLANHYGLGARDGDWRRVDGLRAQGRGGILGFAATLAKQSGASRTSPILRGNWLSEVVLGEKLPRPPKDVPVLPEEAPAGLTERQLIERHSSDEACAKCHQRIDPLGFALEGFDAIGRARRQDAAGLAINAQAKLADGTSLAGLDGLRAYLLESRRDDFLRQFCRKLLGYALGRGVQLSDKPLIESMIGRLKTHDYRVGDAIELIVRSPQFRDVRGRDYLTSNYHLMRTHHFSRRAFLRGVGVTMALPWLESFNVWGDEPARHKPASEAPVRLAVLFSGNGFQSKEWWARGEGREMELGRVLTPLADFSEKLLFVRGLYHEEARKGNIHSSQTGNMLSGAPIASGGEIRSGTSFDQLVAQTYGRSTKVPSLVLACERSNPSVHKNYSMLYSSHISWSSPTTPTPLELYPALAFDRLFKDDTTPEDKSILDAVLADAQDLRRGISRSDQHKLDEYLDSVRDVEKRIENAGKRGELQGWRPTLDMPRPEQRPADGIPQDIGEHMRLMCDILVLGFQTDTTRITTLKLNNDHSALRFPNLPSVQQAGHGIDYMIHHLLSHSDGEDYLKVNQFFLEQVGYLARKLDSIQEGPRTLLDNSMVLLCSSMMVGARHDNDQLPVVVLGGAGGRLKGGRVLDYKEKPDRQMCRLFLSMMDKMELRPKAFGDATKALEEV